MVQQKQAVTYEIALSGTSFNGVYEDNDFQEIPALRQASTARTDTFKLVFTQNCLQEMTNQFTPEFYTAQNAAGTSYKDFITQQNDIIDRLIQFSEWVLGVSQVDLNGVESPDNQTPKTSFLKTGAQKEAPKCMRLTWDDVLLPVEFIINVREIQD